MRRATSVNTSPPSQIMISPSASILILPMHTTIAEMRRWKLGQHFAAIADYDIAIRLNPDYAKHTSIADLRRATSVNTSPPSQIMISPSASILIMPGHTSIAELRRATSVNTSPPSQIMISPSASILMMPMHTTIAEMRRATSVNTSPPSQIMISPSASILMMPKHTSIAELRRLN